LNEEIPGDFEVYPDSVHIGYDDECEIYIPVCKM
jgi:predicted transcriptional regulator YdeE